MTQPVPLASMILAAHLAFAGAASAQTYAPPGQPGAYVPPPVGVQRTGWLVGFGIGGGSMADTDCTGDCKLRGLAVDIHVGLMLAPNLALVLDGSAVQHQFGDNGGSLGNIVSTIAAQLWVTSNVWLKGGLGAGRLLVKDSEGNEVGRVDSNGGGALLAAGFEILQTSSFTLDVQLRGAAAKYSGTTISNGSLLLGFTWF